MKKPLFALSALAAIVASSAAHAQQDLPPVDVQSVLKSLETAGTANEAANQQLFNKALGEIHQAAASGPRAVEFYEKAIRATNYAGLQQQVADFQAWKKKQGDKLRSNEFQQALQFHLRYLSMSLRVAQGTPAKELIPELIAYTSEVYAAKPAVLSDEMMKRAVSDSVFVRWYGIAHQLKGMKNWEMVPVAADGIWEKTILPEMRIEKNPAILRYWDERLQREANLAAEQRLDMAANNFDNITRATLLWRRAEDMALLGSPNRAINEMLGLIKSHPTHPSNAAWISQLKAMLAPEEKGEK